TLPGRQNFTPTVVKYHNDEVSHSPTSAVKTAPPTTGSTQPGVPLRDRNSIFATNAPKKKQPSSEWMSTRVVECSNPNAYKHIIATGTTSRNAIRPDHRCSGETQPGVRFTPGSLPHMASAETSCTSANRKAPEASHTLTVSGLVKPGRVNAISVAVCTRPYTPSATETAAPMANG